MRHSLGVAPYPSREMLDSSYDPTPYYQGRTSPPTPSISGQEDNFSLSDWIDEHQTAIIVGGVALFGFALLTATGNRR